MQAQGQFITLREGSETKALLAPELGGWLLRYTRHLPGHGYVDALHFSQEVVDRYPNQMYAGNPLLFPMVSFNSARGQEHHYEWQGEIYALPQHGFARRSKWKTTQIAERSVLFELTDSEETRKHYPFSFLCQVGYEIRDGRLHVRQKIENRGSKVMPFSAGIHPYFNVPLSDAGSRGDCYLDLPSCRKVIQHNNWQSWTAEAFEARRLPVSEDVSGTLFLTDLVEREIRLIDPRSQLKITLNFADASAHRFVAFWSKSTTEPFYCIEPWTALPNSFARKDTELILLQPGEKFEAAMWISLDPL